MNPVPERLIPGSEDWHFSGHQHLQRYGLAAAFASGLDVLDWACGVGYGAQVLVQCGARSVVGADVSDEALAYAKAHYQSPRLHFVAADAEVGPPQENAFDLVVSFETIEHLRSPEKFIDGLHRALRPEGRLLISAPNALQHGRHPSRPIRNTFHFSEPDYEQLVSWLEPKFTVSGQWEQSPHLDVFSGQMALEAARLSQPRNYAWCRILNSTENLLRRVFRSSLPDTKPLPPEWPGRWAEISPLLPERRASAHTFILLCTKR